ncbi:MAG: YHS domain-containing protein [Nitrososphaerota archaeon]|nr:YHS domain-containing protein [Nitrososphaerota archaeon]
MAIDPVCGMPVDERSAKYVSSVGEVVYFFCSKACKESFDKAPLKYLRGGPSC